MANFIDLSCINTKQNKEEIFFLNSEHIISVHIESDQPNVYSLKERKNMEHSITIVSREDNKNYIYFKNYNDAKEAYDLILERIRHNIT